MNESEAFAIVGAMETIGDRIKYLRLLVPKRTQEEFAALLGVSRGAVGNWELNQGIKRENLTLVAQKTGTSVDWLSTGVGGTARPGLVPLAGAVGAGSEMILYSEGDNPNEWAIAPEGATSETAGVVIRGSSLGATFEGWVVFFNNHRRAPHRGLLGQMCVAGLADGRILVKQLKAGQLEGRFDLHSNTEPPIYDAEVVWASPVITISPPSVIIAS